MYAVYLAYALASVVLSLFTAFIVNSYKRSKKVLDEVIEDAEKK